MKKGGLPLKERKTRASKGRKKEGKQMIQKRFKIERTEEKITYRMRINKKRGI